MSGAEAFAAGAGEQLVHSEGGAADRVSCPLLSGPSTKLVWTMKENMNAAEEAHAGGDYRQAA
jgi:hypothetical protein